MDRLTIEGVPAGRVHFIGIGGAGMSALAEILLARGFDVSGSDSEETPITARLGALGAGVTIGHDERLVLRAGLVIWSTAIRPENPERAAAERARIPAWHRADLLAALVRSSRSIAVAGSHGKTSTTAMIAHVLVAAGHDPTVLVGGVVKSLGSGARIGRGPWLVAEADESDGSFLKLRPEIALVTNVDREHLDHFGTEADLGRAFRSFAEGARRVAIIGAGDCGDDRHGLATIAGATTYGETPAAHWRLEDVVAAGLRTSGDVFRDGAHVGRIEIPLPGRHYLLNALGAVAAAVEAGVAPEIAIAALREFGGVDRRFTIVGEVRHITVVDDYGHHPTEIKATLGAARAAFPGRRLIVAFQAHRYTRTRDLLDEFSLAFDAADQVLVTAIYAAGEAAIPGVDSGALVRALGRRRPAIHVPDPMDVVPAIVRLVLPGDVVIFQGAGDLNRVAPALVKALSE